MNIVQNELETTVFSFSLVFFNPFFCKFSYSSALNFHSIFRFKFLFNFPPIFDNFLNKLLFVLIHSFFRFFLNILFFIFPFIFSIIFSRLIRSIQFSISTECSQSLMTSPKSFWHGRIILQPLKKSIQFPCINILENEIMQHSI